ncbi:phosphate regulon sensor histidine kinase PhoR [Celerinatantimonas sp. MCCC 1A17872]|uniref:phosphate regulon sensor histidine kinase PhoR n=1 Tax=Celerinatantimonas sp. MCCC 1A17872 TaxID=3177514 RepID=UPI0038C637A7
MLMPDTLGRLFWRLVWFYLPFLVVGWFFDHIFLALFVGCVVHLFWFYYQQRKLLNWLYVDKRLTPPQGNGSWQPVFYGIYQLVKRRLNRERELAQLMKSFRLGAESLPDAIVVFSSSDEITWCNRLASELLGLKWPVDAGQHVSNLIRHPSFVNYLSHRHFQEALEISSPARPDLLLECRVMPYGQQFLMLVRDITQQRKLDKMRKHFISNVSHELRTPLTVLRGYLEMFDDDLPEQKVWQRAHSMMSEQAIRMDNLVNQLLVLARIEAAPVVDIHDEINVPSLLDSLSSEAEQLAKDKTLTFSFNIDSDLWMHGSSEQMRSAFANLVYNAVKYCDQPGHVEVSWSKEPTGNARFAVKDSGPGIRPEHLLRLTERFYRVDKDRSRQTGGAGLGLSIVKHALQHHRSELSIESEFGKGSCFSFLIPSDLVFSPDKDDTPEIPELQLFR